ncbi:MAG: hypothetical protein NZ602_09095 [Thermoguttaceae bacterium]|nr:hypothetical protein [Thermoguttaceae bacterium]MDW8039382.1 hypothetical protein [Thermoguttaceae bacterium]
MFAKVIVGIGFAAAMLGIGAFVGGIVIWMGRIELTSRIPPGGTPQLSSPSASNGEGAARRSIPSTPPQSPTGAELPTGKSSHSIGGIEDPQAYLTDRSQILLEIELVELDRSQAEEVLGQSAARDIGALGRKLLQSMIGTATAASDWHTSAGASFSPEVATTGQSASNLSKLFEKNNSSENHSSSASETTQGSKETEGALPQLTGDQRTNPTSLEAGKHTPSFRERWGIGAEKLVPSGNSLSDSKGPQEASPTPQFQRLRSDSSQSSRPSLPAGESEASRTGVGLWRNRSASEKGGESANLPHSSQLKKKKADGGHGLEELSCSDWMAGLDELQRLRIARRIGSGKLALLHRWPSQIDFVVPELMEAGGGGTQPVYTAKLHCVAEGDKENHEFTLELVAEVWQGAISGGSQKVDRQCSADLTSGTLASAGVQSTQTRKKLSYVFPAQVCQAGRLNLLMGLPAPAERQTGSLVLCAVVRGKVQNQPGGLSQVPLSESELRERAVAQCRYLEALLQAQFPTSRIQLSLAAGKLFVHGQTASWPEQEEILALLRRRAIQQWKMHQLSTGSTLAGVRTESGDGGIVNMLQVGQVRVRLQMVELAFPARTGDQTARPERGPASAISSLSSETQQWLQSVSEAASGHQAMVVPAASAVQWEEMLTRKVARIVWTHEWVGPSGRKEIVSIQGREGSRSGTGVLGEKDNRPFSAAPVALRQQTTKHTGTSKGPGADSDLSPTWPTSFPAESRECQVEILAQCTDHGAVRLEVVPAVKQQLFTEAATQSGLLSQTHCWQIHALIQPDQWLLAPIAELPESAKHAGSSARTVLLVAAEAISEGGKVNIQTFHASASPSAKSSPPGKSSSQLTIPQASDNLASRKAEPVSYEEATARSYRPPISKERARLPGPGSQDGPSPLPAESERLQALQEVLANLFPHSQVQLRWEADRLVVEGRAANLAEASQILAVVRAEALPDPSAKVSLVNRLRVVPTSPVEYLLRVRFVRVNGTALRQAAEKVKRDFPQLVPLAGPLLDLAERGGHLVLEPAGTEHLPELLAQAERLDLVRVVAQPTFGILPSQPAEYLLPISTGIHDSLGTQRLVGQSPPSSVSAESSYLVCRLRPQWTEQGRWQLEITVELVGRAASGKQASRMRLVAELEPGQTSAAAIPMELYPGPGRLVVLTTPELRNLPPGDTNVSGSTGFFASEGMTDQNQTPPMKYSASDSSPPSFKGPQPEVPSGNTQAGALPPRPTAPSVGGLPSPGASSPPGKASTPSDKRAPPSSAPMPLGWQQSPSATGPQEPEATRAASSPHGLLPKLGQLFRSKKEKTSSPPGYTLAESPEAPYPPPLEVTVPEAPPPDSSGNRIIPRVIRPSSPR